MNKDSRPLVVLYGYRTGRNSLVFVGRAGLINIKGDTSLVQKILSLCNGFNTVYDIQKKLPDRDVEKSTEILFLLEQQGILCDSQHLYELFHSDSSNPMSFSKDIGGEDLSVILGMKRVTRRKGRTLPLPEGVTSNLTDILKKRVSTREFRKGVIPLAQLVTLLEVTYGKIEGQKWCVPSGGALYPLDLYLVVHDESQEIPIGTYQWIPEERSLVLVKASPPSWWLSKTLNTKSLLLNSACVLCVAVNFERIASKYSNRSYRLALLEAGHSAQNAYLFCAEQGLGIVEYGGFFDVALGRELGLDTKKEFVVTTFIVGIPDDEGNGSLAQDREIRNLGQRLRALLVGEDKPIADLSVWDTKVKNFRMSSWVAQSTYRPETGNLKNTNRAFATGSTTDEAVLKALSEGFERYSLDQSESHIFECATGLSGSFLDPRRAVPFEEKQKKFLGNMRSFSLDEKIHWVHGVRCVDGSRLYVPSEMVFYSNKKITESGRPFYRASSSGVAAHSDKQVAIETALWELIERDAFCVTWYTRRDVSAIPSGLLPEEFQSRIRAWSLLGYRVSFLDLSIDGPPVVLAMIWSRNKSPALCSGASCRPNFLDALSRAFSEAEFMAMTWHRRRVRVGMSAQDVRSVEDHGIFYLDPKNLMHVEWLLDSKEDSLTDIGMNFDPGINFFDPIVVDMTPKKHPCGLFVVRVLSEKLLPINFGYGTEHCGHGRIKALQSTWSVEYPSIPHFFS